MGSTPWPQRQRHKSEILNARRYQRTKADRFTSQVHFHNDADLAWQTWRLIPVKVEGTITSPNCLVWGPYPRMTGMRLGSPLPTLDTLSPSTMNLVL